MGGFNDFPALTDTEKHPLQRATAKRRDIKLNKNVLTDLKSLTSKLQQMYQDNKEQNTNHFRWTGLKLRDLYH